MSHPPTPPDDLDAAVDVLVSGADEWARTPIAARLALLVGVRERTVATMDRWIALAAAAKGVPPGSPGEGEEWLGGPYGLLRYVDALRESLDRLWRGRPTFDAERVRRGPAGEAVVRTFPMGWHDRLLLNGFTADVWMDPSVTPDNLAGHVAAAYREPPAGTVCAVLGAGNIAEIPPVDALGKLYVDGQAVALKLNPVNEAMGPIFEEVFAELIDRGFLRILYGGTEVGARLAAHPSVDTVHLTGSRVTHDTIVFGPGGDGERRRREGRPALEKPITSELGGVSPVIVVPGAWSEADLRFQAEHVVTQKLVNAGFNCIAAQVLIVADGWDHADRFRELVEEALARAPDRPAYYPGAEERRRRAAASHPDTVTVGDPPRTLARNLDPTGDHTAFSEELFCAVLAETRLPHSGPGAFLDAAVELANDRLAGTLAVGIIVDPATRSLLGRRFDAAVADLRYGCVGVNVWTAFGFLEPRVPWGAHPGHTVDDVGSGIGAVHNALMFDRPAKSVVTGPFRPFPRAWSRGSFHLSPVPPWFISNRTGAVTSELITRFTADPSPRRLPAILRSALQGGRKGG